MNNNQKHPCCHARTAAEIVQDIRSIAAALREIFGIERHAQSTRRSVSLRRPTDLRCQRSSRLSMDLRKGQTDGKYRDDRRCTRLHCQRWQRLAER